MNKTSTLRNQLLGLVALIACLAGPSLHARELGGAPPVTKMYLDINGIPGEVTDPGFEGQIEVESYSWIPTTGPGELSLVKPLDSSSPALLLAVATGNLLRGATLTVVQTLDGVVASSEKIDMRDVLVTSYVILGVTESVTLSFQSSKVKTKNGGIDPDPVSGMYLGINGLTGEVTDPGFEGQIEVLAFSWTPTSGPGEITLTKNIDSSSPDIFAMVISGTLLKSARLTEATTINDKIFTSLRIDLLDVLITSMVIGSDTETITLSFQRAKISQ